MKTETMRSSVVLTVALAVSAGCFGTGETKAANLVANLTGTAKLDGPAPKRAPISMAREPSCAANHKTPPMAEDVVVGPNGALQNVVIYISEGLPDMVWDPPQTPVILSQDGCTYTPHVVALQTAQKLRVVNGDKTSHNIHPMPFGNPEWNKSQPPGMPPFEESFARQEVGIPVKCNVHPWMRAYIAVLRHPFFSVTNESGAFAIKNLPPGTYTVTAWHEKLGTATQKITAGAGESKALQFVFKPKPGM
jgi:Carboxypeptidase regulatory-like domain